METTERGKAKLFLVFAGLCVLALPLIVFSALSVELPPVETPRAPAAAAGFDEGGQAVFTDYRLLPAEYLAGAATERTLEQYYALRQYPGSPPVIPHKVEEADLAPSDCLACHRRGGFAPAFKRFTPRTPHPEQTACRQCHVPAADTPLFVGHEWASIAPPRLGWAALPGAPPPIAHDLQTRGNCVACHVGPGAVAPIRVEHPGRGNCRQCHVPQVSAGIFERQPNF